MTHSPVDPPGARSSDWEAAHDRATMLRLDRLEPPLSRRRADRWLGPVLVVLWVVSVAAHLLSRFGIEPREALQVTGSESALVLLLLGFVWLYASGRVTLAGSDSPATPLSKADRRTIRRQLTRKTPPDLEHADITLELAHRQQRLTLGYLALVAIELPNTVGIAIDNPDTFILVISATGVLLFLAVGIYGLITSRRLAPLIRQLEARPETLTQP